MNLLICVTFLINVIIIYGVTSQSSTTQIPTTATTGLTLTGTTTTLATPTNATNWSDVFGAWGQFMLAIYVAELLHLTESEFNTSSTTMRAPKLGLIGRIIRRISEGTSAILTDISDSVRKIGTNTIFDRIKRNRRLKIEKYLQNKPIRRRLYHWLQVPGNYFAYYAPGNVLKRVTSRFLAYLADLALTPKILQDDGILGLIVHKIVRLMKAMKNSSASAVRRRIIGIPLMWKITLGPPDRTMFMQFRQGNGTDSAPLRLDKNATQAEQCDTEECKAQRDADKNKNLVVCVSEACLEIEAQ